LLSIIVKLVLYFLCFQKLLNKAWLHSKAFKWVIVIEYLYTWLLPEKCTISLQHSRFLSSIWYLWKYLMAFARNPWIWIQGVSVMAFDNILGIQKHSKVYEYKIGFTMMI
jgi:hypothetical protein